jgi:hypothetical protein
VRTAGDVLITFDFGGSGSPVLGLLKWVTTGATSQCFSANALPCWGNRVNLSAAGFAEGAVNSVTVNDPIANVSLPANTFGEAAINLTAAGVFPAGTCEALGSAFLKSRASASFPAEVKDFVAPQPVNIANCGTINIIKHTDPRGINQNFSFTSTIPNPAVGSTTPDCSLDTTPSSFTLNDHAGVDPASPITAGTDNTEHCANVPAGSYTVTEGADPLGFTFESLTCSAGGSQDATIPKQANITVAPNSTVTCIYTNQQQLGAIKITKTSSKAAATPLAGATFSITSGGTPISGSPFTTDSNGTICVAGLAFGDYVVTETAAPPGYAIDNPNGVTVTVDHNASCSGTPNAPPTFTDTPLTDLTVHVASQAAGGTQSSIRCIGPSPATTDVGNSPEPDSGVGDPETVTANGLAPGTYTCTVTIDP